MNLNSYEAKVIGIENYKDIARRHGLFTKKWTYGRMKEFYKEVREVMKDKTQNNKIKLFGRIASFIKRH